MDNVGSGMVLPLAIGAVAFVFLAVITAGDFIDAIETARARHRKRKEALDAERAAKAAQERAEKETRQLAYAREAEAKKRRAAVAAASELEIAFRFFEHRARPTHLAAYARKHCAELLRDGEDLVRRWVELHRDAYLVDHLKRTSPETYERLAWQVRSVALAEQIAVETHLPKPAAPQEEQPAPAPEPSESAMVIREPSKPKETPDEYVARKARVARDQAARTGKLERARILAKVSEQQLTEAALREAGCDEDQSAELLAAFMATLDGRETDNGDFDQR